MSLFGHARSAREENERAEIRLKCRWKKKNIDISIYSMSSFLDIGDPERKLTIVNFGIWR